MKAILINGQPKNQLAYKVWVDSEGNQTATKGATDAQWIAWGFKEIIEPVYDSTTQLLGGWYETTTEILRYITDKTVEQIDADSILKTKDEFKNNLEGVFAFATTPDGTKEYAIKLGNDGKISTALIP